MGRDEEGKEVPVIMPISPAAADILEAWQAATYEADCDAVGLYGSHLGKLHGYVLRIALVTELLSWAAGSDMDPDRKSDLEGQGESERVEFGGSGVIQKKKQ